MASRDPSQELQDFLGSAHIFASAIDRLMERQLNALMANGLSFSQLKLLKLVSVTEGYTISDVAAFLRVSNAAASKAADRLVRRGLIERHEGVEDRRVVHLSLSDEGRRLLNQFESCTIQALNEIFEPFGSRKLVEATAMLDDFSVALVAHEGGEASDGPCFRCGIYFRDRCLLRERGQTGCYFNLHKRRQGRAAEGAGL